MPHRYKTHTNTLADVMYLCNDYHNDNDNNNNNECGDQKRTTDTGRARIHIHTHTVVAVVPNLPSSPHHHHLTNHTRLSHAMETTGVGQTMNKVFIIMNFRKQNEKGFRDKNTRRRSENKNVQLTAFWTAA